MKEKDDAPQEREKTVLEEICFLVDEAESAIKKGDNLYAKFARVKDEEEVRESKTIEK